MKAEISHISDRNTKRPRIIRRVIALVMMALLSGATALVVSTAAHADDNPTNYSFYKLSSSLAAFFSNAKSPDQNAAEIKRPVWGSMMDNPGDAGSMLGYVDPNFSWSLEFLNSQISGSSSAVGYNTLVQIPQSGGASSTDTKGMLDYAHFGATLNAMGLDSMGTGLSLGFMDWLGGGLVLILYIFTGVVDLLFTGIVSTLKALNPFKLFYEGVRLVNPGFADGMTGGQAPPGFLGGLSTWIGTWYQVLNNISWQVLVPIFIGTLVLALLLFKNMNRGSALKKLVIRVLFIGLGLPLIGSMYTGVLNSMGDASQSGSAGSTQVVLSTYVDFQNWASKGRLFVPEKAVIEWNAGQNKPTDKALANVRNTALEINKGINNSWSGIKSSMNVAQDQSWTDAAMKAGTGDTSGGLNGYMSTIDLLNRYINGQKVDAASYETAIKGDISTTSPYTNGADGRKRVADWFTQFSDPKSGLPGIDNPDVVNNNPVLMVAPGTGLKADPAGATSGDKKYTSTSKWNCGVWVSNNGTPLNCNMSTLSMYNYLNTSFGSDSMTMYSSNKSTSGATREMHNSVTPVGTGMMRGLYWTNAVVLLGSFVIIGLGYAFSVLFANIRRSFQLMTAIPFATIGAIPGIAKVIIYATSMILEVIVTLFLYRFIQTFLISIPQIAEMPLSAVLNSVSGTDAAATNLLSGGTLSMVLTVVSIIALVAFTILALRVRKTVVKGINEVVTKLIDKFMDTTVAPPGGKGGLMPALAGGLASGAGMAAANKFMNGGQNGVKKPEAPVGQGPGGIVTGDIPSPGEPGGPDGGAQGELPGGGPGGGGGDSGGPLALSVSSSTGMQGADSKDQTMARSVDAQGGLSEPGKPNSGDITDTMADSVDKTQAQYRAKDKATLDAAQAGGMAVAKGAEAVGRGMAGDAPGAASAGMAAAGHAKSVQGNAQRAQEIKKDIDGPAPSKVAKTSGNAPKTSASTSSAQSSGTSAPKRLGAPKQSAPITSVARPAQSPRTSAPSAAPSRSKQASAPTVNTTPRVVQRQPSSDRPPVTRKQLRDRKDGDA